MGAGSIYHLKLWFCLVMDNFSLKEAEQQLNLTIAIAIIQAGVNWRAELLINWKP